MLCTSKEMLDKAAKGGYAVPAINTQGGTYDIIRAICMSAERMQSPIILAHYMATGQYSGDDWFVETAKWCAERVSVPVAIHLDHCEDFATCVRQMHTGFTSIMYDGSALPMLENAKRTEEVVRACHACGIPVEAEIGTLEKRDADGNLLVKSTAADPEEVREFLKLCHPDSLAVGIGNAHGFYTEKPKIQLEILNQIRAFTDIPLVLHGGTGLDDDIVKQAISRGIAKFNVATQIRHAHIQYLKQGIEEKRAGVDNGHAWKLSEWVCGKLADDVDKIIELAGSAGKA